MMSDQKEVEDEETPSFGMDSPKLADPSPGMCSEVSVADSKTEHVDLDDDEPGATEQQAPKSDTSLQSAASVDETSNGGTKQIAGEEVSTGEIDVSLAVDEPELQLDTESGGLQYATSELNEESENANSGEASTSHLTKGPSESAAMYTPSKCARYINIQVTPAKEVKEGGANYYNVRSSKHDAPAEEFFTQRRFDDLVTLHENIKTNFRGCIIPPRPGKTIFNSTLIRNHGDMFLTDRALEMEEYLQQVSEHVEICSSKVLEMFLESDATLKESSDWNRAKPKASGLLAGLVKGMKKAIGTESSVPTPSQVQSTATHEVDILRMLAEQKIPRRKLSEHVDQVEKDLETEKDRLGNTYGSVNLLTRAAEVLLECNRKCEDSAGDLSQALEALARAEESSGAQQELKLMKSDIDSLRAGRDALLKEYSTLQKLRSCDIATLSILHKQLAMVPRVVKALLTREQALVTLEAVRRQGQDINVAYNRLEARELSSHGLGHYEITKMNHLRRDKDNVKHTKDAAEEMYHKSRSRNQRDLVDHRSNQSKAMTRMTALLAQTHAEAAEKQASAWLKMAERLSIDVSEYGPNLEKLNINELGRDVSESEVFAAD